MRITRAHIRTPEIDESLSVIQNIYAPRTDTSLIKASYIYGTAFIIEWHMSAFDQDILGTEILQSPGGLTHIFQRSDITLVGEDAGFRDIGCNYGCEGEEPGADGSYGVFGKEAVAGGCDHYRVDY